MRAGLRYPVLFGLLSGAGTLAFAAMDGAPDRYRIEAELRPTGVSVCGRFGLEASARYTPEVRSADGRFSLKAVNAPAVGCDPFPDPLFSDGFEAP